MISVVKISSIGENWIWVFMIVMLFLMIGLLVLFSVGISLVVCGRKIKIFVRFCISYWDYRKVVEYYCSMY